MLRTLHTIKALRVLYFCAQHYGQTPASSILGVIYGYDETHKGISRVGGSIFARADYSLTLRDRYARWEGEARVFLWNGMGWYYAYLLLHSFPSSELIHLVHLKLPIKIGIESCPSNLQIFSFQAKLPAVLCSPRSLARQLSNRYDIVHSSSKSSSLPAHVRSLNVKLLTFPLVLVSSTTYPSRSRSKLVYRSSGISSGIIWRNAEWTDTAGGVGESNG